MIAQPYTLALLLTPSVLWPFPTVHGGEGTGFFKWFKSQNPAAQGTSWFIGSNAAASALSSEQVYRNLTYNLGYHWVYSLTGLPRYLVSSPTYQDEELGVKCLEITEGSRRDSRAAQEIRQQVLNVPLAQGQPYSSNSPPDRSNGNLVFHRRLRCTWA